MADLIGEVRDYAAAHFYAEGWDMVATMWTDAEIAEAIRGAKTRRGAIAKAWKVLRPIYEARRAWDIETLRRYGPQPARPERLFWFLASRGGLKPCPDVTTILDGNPFTRFGPLLRRDGLDLDRARAACVEAGYLVDAGDIEGREATTTINDLLALLDTEARGRPCYPLHAYHAPAGVEPDHQMETCDDIPF